MIDFHQQVAVITGAGNGLGRKYALELAARGAAIVVNDLGTSVDGHGASGSAAQAVVDEIVAAGGRAVASVETVNTADGGEAIVAAGFEAFGRVDVVIHSAGILRNNAYVDMPPEDIQAVIDVHLFGAFNVTQPAFRHMVDQGYGRIVLISSNQGFGNPGRANYAAAKMGVVGLTHVLAHEGRDHGIAVNALMPLGITRMSANKAEQADKMTETFAPIKGRIRSAWVTPMVAYLASNACQENGEIFSAIGGRYARVFMGIAPGWVSPGDEPPTAEDLAANMASVGDLDHGYAIPRSFYDEVAHAVEQYKARGTKA
ncbi:MAG: short-chain type dehydrogenase/reductase [Acidimicrobiia bacterium]|nr:short-chain type dehydrogenase/reductase [Acidimicrobiia bacterium]